MKIRLILIIVGLSFLQSCKKDKLVGEYEIFQGKWKWSYSVEKIHYNWSQFTVFNTVLASSYEKKYELNFLEKGKVEFIENGDVSEKYRIVVNKFVSDNPCLDVTNGYEYILLLNNDNENIIGGCINSDTLLVYRDGFPLSNYVEGGDIQHTFRHYFVKQ